MSATVALKEYFGQVGLSSLQSNQTAPSRLSHRGFCRLGAGTINGRSFAYSSPVTIVRNETFIEAIYQCFEVEDNSENQEAAPFQEGMDLLKNKMYNEWLSSVG
ncbi:hypothetical protein AM501_31080 [Aneurinibacillus migulanus]|uniref:hypothetical protein n=1 Tax=Aneurinibacillus migulanus TaxID=47500 RepID=UPI0005BA5C2A|nr:hypothetical protein [Aneurinibacillus migulanus]KIV56333.1 hypothetical protein TS64_09825 [Aneurinibacillus migulanus]KPD04538.1 hypothetical protein AM501_31080 [Aneurinibacillus migulanus]